MDIRETIKSAIKQLLSNKGRTVLTMLGMFIGIGAVIMIQALGTGLTQSVTSSFSEMGLGVFQISAKDNKNAENYISLEDMELLSAMPEVKTLVAANTSEATLLNQKSEAFKVNIMGAQPAFTNDIMPKKILAGRNLSAKDEQAYGRSIMIADSVAMALFQCGKDYNKVIDETINITINNQPNTFTVVGVYNTSVASNLSQKELEKTISRQTYYIPYSTLDQLLGLGGKVGMVAGLTQDGYDQVAATSKMGQILNRRHHLKDGYTITTYAQFITMVEMIMSTITLFISAIASISLIVGGVGIMNIMLVTVKERTREIGVRKALGASNKVILRQFLIEALMLTVIAGLIGMLLGYIGALYIGNVINVQAQFTIGMLLFSSIVSSVIGIVFGVYPAYQAARLDPIEALRAD